MKQLELFTGFYSCQNCGHVVSDVRKIRRFYLCSDCIILPPQKKIESESERNQNSRFIALISDLEKARPSKWYTRPKPKMRVREANAFYPYCDCGELRQEIGMGHGGLWGGPFQSKCMRCDAKEFLAGFYNRQEKLDPNKDDESWLDLLYTAFPEYFETGILPDLWFELKYG